MDTQKLKQLDVKTKRLFEILLKGAQPNRDRKYALIKLLLSEGSPLTKDGLSSAINSFYKLKFEHRTERQLKRTFLVSPYPWLCGQFMLSFRNALVSETEIYKTATSFRHLVRNAISVPEEIASADLLHLVVHRLTKPRVDQIDSGIGIEVFSYRWRDVSFFKFGSKYEEFFDALDLAIENAQDELELQPIDVGLPRPVDDNRVEEPFELDLTQTDLDWFKGILAAFEKNERPPLYPLRKGPQTSVVLRIERLVRAAYSRYPFRHSQIEEKITSGCLYFLKIYKQEPKNSKLAA